MAKKAIQKCSKCSVVVGIPHQTIRQDALVVVHSAIKNILEISIQTLEQFEFFFFFIQSRTLFKIQVFISKVNISASIHSNVQLIILFHFNELL